MTRAQSDRVAPDPDPKRSAAAKKGAVTRAANRRGDEVAQAVDRLDQHLVEAEHLRALDAGEFQNLAPVAQLLQVAGHRLPRKKLDEWIAAQATIEHEARRTRLRLEALRDGALRICERCEQEFAPARADARYCSARCRVAAHRTKKQ